jgi:uncharacterized protein (TIGR00369 family)
MNDPAKLVSLPEADPRVEDSRGSIPWGPRHVKQVGWHAPLDTARQRKQVPGREFLQGIVDGRFPPPPIAELFNSRLISVGDGAVVFSCMPDESVYNPLGTVHGGWLCMLMDSAAGCAVHTLLPAGVGYTSIEIKVSFLQAIHADRGAIQVSGRALRVGRRVAFAEARAVDGDGELVGHATASIAVLRPERADQITSGRVLQKY